MTRWKRERTYTLFTKMEHHYWSQWWYSILDACSVLGIPVARQREVYLTFGGEWRTQEHYIVPAEWLERIGGVEQLRALAEEKHHEVMERRRTDLF